MLGCVDASIIGASISRSARHSPTVNNSSSWFFFLPGNALRAFNALTHRGARARNGRPREHQSHTNRGTGSVFMVTRSPGKESSRHADIRCTWLELRDIQRQSPRKRTSRPLVERTGFRQLRTLRSETHATCSSPRHPVTFRTDGRPSREG